MFQPDGSSSTTTKEELQAFLETIGVPMADGSDELDKVVLSPEQLRALLQHTSERVGLVWSDELGAFLMKWVNRQYGKSSLSGVEIRDFLDVMSFSPIHGSLYVRMHTSS